MRFIAILILVYCVYLFLKYLLKLYLNSINRKKPVDTQQGKRRSKIDLSKISEADYEEIKTPKREQ
jgi:NADPH-dependent 7-cyano-7-deazaguanine reductase QueF-like protein